MGDQKPLAEVDQHPREARDNQVTDVSPCQRYSMYRHKHAAIRYLLVGLQMSNHEASPDPKGFPDQACLHSQLSDAPPHSHTHA
jgi:hypothetical protein